MRHNCPFNRFLILAALFGVLDSAAALAQVVPPGPSRPEFIQRQNRIDTRPEVTGAPIISAPAEEEVTIKSGISFVLKRITFEGLTQFTEADLKPLYQDKLGKNITLGELNHIVAEITAFYRNHGFILTRAVLTPQRIENGVVAVRIVEGFISEVKIEGDAGDGNGVIRRYADKIRNSKPLNSKDLERYLLLMGDLPGVKATAVLMPSLTTPGAADVVITVTRKTVEASATLDNRGSRFLGPEQGGATLAVNNVLGMNEQTELRVLSSVFSPDELRYIDLRHEEPIGSEGTKLILDANYARTKPSFNLASLLLDGTSTSVSAGLTHPLTRSRQSNWFVNTDFTARRVNTDIFGTTNLYQDHLRVLTAGSSYDFIDSTSAVNQMAVNLSKGFNWDTDNNGRFHSRGNGNASFVKVAATATRLQPISGPWDLFGAMSGQYASRALLAAEEFAIGGQTFGSAYDSAELTGDAGIAARAELRYSRPAALSFLQSYQAYGFLDGGRVFNRDIVPGSEPEHASLTSTGLGARFNLTHSVSGGAELALPLNRPVSANGMDGYGPRAFFNLQVRY